MVKDWTYNLLLTGQTLYDCAIAVVEQYCCTPTHVRSVILEAEGVPLSLIILANNKQNI